MVTAGALTWCRSGELSRLQKADGEKVALGVSSGVAFAKLGEQPNIPASSAVSCATPLGIGGMPPWIARCAVLMAGAAGFALAGAPAASAPS